MNFGLAVELAKAEGFKADLVIVGDDCALPGTGLAGRRGIAGTILVNKVCILIRFTYEYAYSLAFKICQNTVLSQPCELTQALPLSKGNCI